MSLCASTPSSASLDISFFKFSFRIFLFQRSFMEPVLVQLESKLSWKQAMRKTCRTNKLNVQIVAAYTPLKFRASYTRFKAIYRRRSTDKAERWLQNELKAFYWFLVAVSCVRQLNIPDFSQREWTLIFEVFEFKQAITLEYEGKKLLEQATNKQNWQIEQQNLLNTIVQQSQENGNKWNEYARKLFQLSQRKFFRTGKQCRERWLNHLDPNKKHGEWHPEQDVELAKMFIAEGKKWSLVSKKLGGSRTEHMVKNRFKTLVSRQKKLYPQINHEFYLLKTFVDPQCAQKYIKKESGESEIKNEAEVIKTQQRSCEEINKIEAEVKRELELNSSLGKLIKDDGNDIKDVPQTSATFQLHQPFSPWYVITTPTFSPYYVSVPTFSTYEAGFVNNQFYYPKNDKSQQN